MGTSAYFERLCRLCGDERTVLIRIFGNQEREKYLVGTIEKYMKITVSVADALPHQVCHPCFAKLDAMVNFVDTSVTTQANLQKILKELTLSPDKPSDNATRVSEDTVYEILQDVKVEIKETEVHQGSKTRRGKTCSSAGKKSTRVLRNRSVKKPDLEKSRYVDENQPELKSPITLDEQEESDEGSSKDMVIGEEEDDSDVEDGESSSRFQSPASEKTSQYSMRCSICEVTLESATDFMNHAKETHHSRKVRYMCPHCPSVFEELCYLASHRRREHKDSFKKQQVTKNHQKYLGALSSARRIKGGPAKSRTTRRKYPARCAFCEVTVDNVFNLKAHFAEAHPSSEVKYMCPQCPHTFNKICYLASHRRRVHSVALKSCPQCNKSYPSYYLSRHMQTHSATRPFPCQECDKTFKSKDDLCAHKRKHKPTEERYTYCCDLCGKRFTQKSNLDSHSRVHSGDRPFTCEFCGKGFSQKVNMEDHRRIHTGERPFVCEICGISYSRQSQLVIHRKKHTGEKTQKCRFCDKMFFRRENVRQHERVHTDARPYKCQFCEKSFRYAGHRKIHERLHTGERPFKCQSCEQAFCESGNLKKHMRVHHPSMLPDHDTGRKEESDPSMNRAVNPAVQQSMRPPHHPSMLPEQVIHKKEELQPAMNPVMQQMMHPSMMNPMMYHGMMPGMHHNMQGMNRNMNHTMTQ